MISRQSFDSSLVALFETRVRETPDAPALTAASPGRGDLRRSYAGLWEEALRFADGLRTAGVRPGDHVGLMLNNEAGYEACVSMLALHRLGCVVVPVNARFAVDELVYVLGKARCHTLVALADLLPVVAAARAKGCAVDRVISVGGVKSWTLDWDEVLAAGNPLAGGWPDIDPDRMVEIIFTSGTTAHPKGAVMTQARCLASGHDFAHELALGADDVYQSFFPFFTTACIHCVLFPAWWAGGAAVLDRVLDVPEVIARMQREGTTKYIGAPTFYILLLEAYRPDEHDLSAIRIFDYGGASMSVEVIRELAAAFPQVELRQTYGMTESGGPGTFLSGADTFTKLGSVGRPAPHIEVRVVDEDAKPLPAGEVGEIALRGPSIMREYFEEPALTERAIRDGWLLTGDVGYLDGDGYLFHVDRKKDMIIRGGHNIGSLEVEEIFYGHPAIQDAAVVGVPHPKLGEDIFAFVVLHTDQVLSVDALRAYCADKLADYKIPRRISFVTALPRGPMGKVLKNVLREMATEAAAA
ncbi:class I adenylate-forming enzyme family protein [Sphingomonas mali]|uniref:class I adenylate-forming enzyme family protein n=1 Tax=Sphingomonas mali TaxID=40682 RepID=UPI000AB822A7|nr:class I adenylate-forming enzyme family protein [Sphingomonas mali]